MPPTLGCGCPSSPARTISDQAKHDAWHALVVEQGGPGGVVDMQALQAARGFSTGTSTGETCIDVKARERGKRASGKLREASR